MLEQQQAQRLEQQKRQQQALQRVLGLQQALELQEQQLLLFCRKRTKQQQR